MGLFLSTSKHKIDKKGRVSIPAPFRASLDGESQRAVALMRPLSGAACLEGSGLSRVHGLAEKLTEMNPISEERDDIATAILADVHLASLDAEGRVVLPEDLVDYAGLEGEALFAGLGDKFQIWRPDRFLARREEARAKARELAGRLPWSKPGAGAGLSGSGGGGVGDERRD